MGDIARLLSIEKLNARVITPDRICADLCENIHLHYRDVRMEFSQDEWAGFRAAINMLGIALEQYQEIYDYREGNNDFLVQAFFDEPVDANTKYWPNRLSIELQSDNTIHFHYRDIRLHLTSADFVQLAEAVHAAMLSLKAHIDRELPPEMDVEEATEMDVPIDYIQPYDAGHRPGWMDEDHRKGIALCKEGIQKGKTPRRILINTKGQRMDGFKRFMAMKELGWKTIPCIVGPFAKQGYQTWHSMFEEDD